MSGIGAGMAEGLVTGIASVVLILTIIGVYRLIKKLTGAAKTLPQDLANRSVARKVADAEVEERLYERVRQEYDSGDIRTGLWTKAEATANSTEAAAIRAKYIQLRFEQLETQGKLKRYELNGGATVSAPEETFEKSETIERPETDESKPIDSSESQKFTNGEILLVVFFIILFILLIGGGIGFST